MEDRLEKAGFEFDAEIVEKRCFKVGDSALRPRSSLRKQRRLWLQKQVMTNQGTSGENEEGNEKEDVAAPRRRSRRNVCSTHADSRIGFVPCFGKPLLKVKGTTDELWEG
ncbi:hypothetical protein IFM89_010423 [Coptis chinensis]|uniref:Uncharacterized protein n=1 Tax=Coptis chinensis TaxID=261450 RepID=A0A835I0Y8_9MAGN|nr:hypothetical protein IFM89_010423 [Coptis chinensis]